MLKAKQKTVSLVVACLATLLTVLFAFAMLFTPTPMKTASAEDTTIVFELGANGEAAHEDGNTATTYTETVDGYTLSLTSGTKMYTGARDAMGNSCIKLGTSSAAGSFTLTAPDDVTSVIIAIAKYKANTTKVSINDTAYTLSGSSNDGAYDAIKVDTDTASTKAITLTTVSGGYRAMVNTITYVIGTPESGDPTCEHVNQTTTNVDATCTENGSITVTCEDCGYVKTEVIPAKGHSYEDVEETKAANCTEGGVMKTVCTVCGTEGTRAIPALGHSFVDGVCSECGEEQPSVATLIFDSTEKRTSFSTTQQVWEENGVTLTNDKGSGSDIADYVNPVRFYKNSTITVAYDNMAKIEFACSSASYATSLQKSIGNEAIASDKIVTVTLSSAQDSYTVTLSDGQVRMNSITVYKPAKIDCATVTVGENLAVNYYVSNSNADAVMYFTFNGKTYDVAGELQTDGKYAGKYKYTLDNIPPQCMTDNISAVLMNGEVELDKLEEYSIQTYAQNMLNNAESSDELKQLVSDMLRYGAAAQNYKDYNTGSLATDGVENLIDASDAVAPEVTASPEKNTEIDSYPVYFTSATVWFDGVNKIRVKVNSIENAFISLDDGETKVALESTTYETDGILATEFDKEFTFQLYCGETLMQTLTYSVNAYAYKMKDHESMGDLATALYRYGVSAENYIA